MKRRASWGNPFFGVFLALAMAVAQAEPAQAQPMAAVETILSEWEGQKRVALRTEVSDPLAVPLIQDLLERFLTAGFRVEVLGAEHPMPDQGLVADVRSRGSETVLILSRAPGQAVLSIHRFTARAEPMEQRAVMPRGATPVRRSWPSGPVELVSPVRGIAFIGNAGGTPRIAVLRDEALGLLEVSPSGIEEIARYDVPQSSTHGVSISAGDLDGDGNVEVATTWAEDRHSVYDGTDSHLHGWIFRPTQAGWESITADMGTYVRIVGERAYRQARGPHSAFAGPVTELELPYGSEPRGAPVPWGTRNLFGYAPIDQQRGLARNESRRLQLVLGKSGLPVSGGLLLEDLGAFRGPRLTVRLETPEYRSGFEKEDRVTENHHYLPARVEGTAAGVAYTIQRGRTAGLPLLGNPSGKDAVVRVRAEDDSLFLEHPFPGVDAFVLDFALLTDAGEPAGIALLANERADGSGKAFLLFQPPR